MEKPRCLTLFEESCRSKHTRQTYANLLNLFLDWAKKDYESLLILPNDQLQILLEDYMIYCKRRFKKAGIVTRFSAIEKFLFVNDRTVNKRKLLMFLPESQKTQQRAITKQECIDLIAHSSSKRVRAIIHLFTSTGCRPEALSEVRLRDIGQMPDDCLSIVLYAGTKNELITFAHSEATKAVNEYLNERKGTGESLRPESFLVRRKFFIANEKNPKPLTVNGLESAVGHAMKQAGIKRIKIDENRFDLPVCGGFRNRFSTIFKMNSDISYVISEMFMDHKIRMESNYTMPTKEQLFEEYKKAIPELMLDESKKLRIENEEKQKTIDKLESDKDRRISELESKMELNQSQMDSVRELLKRIKDSSS